MMKDGGFREDLFYRLSVVRLRLPSLKERLEDIPDLVGFMLQKLAKDETVKARKVSSDAMSLLGAHDWPGNVRELENLIYRSAVVAKGDTILVKDFPSEFVADPVSTDSSTPAEPSTKTTPESSHSKAQKPISAIAEEPLTDVMDDSGTLSESMTTEEAFDLVYAKIRDDMPDSILGTMEKEMVRRALRETGGNQVKASALLGITRATLRKRIEQYSIRF
ncbi:MAG: sigma-54-dependent Fis family transcriptional regulator [Opitutae bacterium]|nr:sigma-54-dependent Fis family transcriptional regulator [Opitutae bacterium]